MPKPPDFKSLIGTIQNYYGHNCKTNIFKLGQWTFQAIFAEGDMRSPLQNIKTLPQRHKRKLKNRIARVLIQEVTKTYVDRGEGHKIQWDIDGYELSNAATGEVILIIGTDNRDDYYPQAFFSDSVE